MWELQEQSRNAVPGFRLDWLPSAAYRYLTPRVTRQTGRIELETGPYIGIFPLLNGEFIKIVPRGGARAVGRMLMVAEGLGSAVSSEFERLVHMGYDTNLADDWEAVLRRAFVYSLLEIEKNGLRTARMMCNRRTGFIRGRVAVPSTLLSLGRQEVNPIHCTYKERIRDTPEHRLLASAAHLLLRTAADTHSLAPVLIRWASSTPRARADHSDIEEVARRLDSGAYAGPRAYYIAALVAARLLLAGDGIALDTEQTVLGEAFLINTASLFERYVRAIIAKALAIYGLVTEKGSTPVRSLFKDGSCELLPDIVISDKRGPILVLDAKYKPEDDPAADDYYQIAIYANTYKLSKAALVLPSMGTAPSRLVKTTTQGTRIVVLRMPLDKWETTEVWLAEEALRLAQED